MLCLKGQGRWVRCHGTHHSALPRYMLANSGVPEVLLPCARPVTQIWRCPKRCCNRLGASEMPTSVCAGVVSGVCTWGTQGGCSLPPHRGSRTGHKRHSLVARWELLHLHPSARKTLCLRAEGNKTPHCDTGLGVWSSGMSLDRQEPNGFRVCSPPLHHLAIGSLVYL